MLKSQAYLIAVITIKLNFALQRVCSNEMFGNSFLQLFNSNIRK